MPTDWQPSQRYPDPSVVVLDEAFAMYKLPLAKVERIATGFRWCEGPVWFGDQRCLIWSDVPGNGMYRWDEATGTVSPFRVPSNNGNGNFRDLQGRLLTCEHRNRRVVRTEHDGSMTVLADRYDGHKLNSPNDVVCKSDGSVWFTDPSFGILGNYEGIKSPPELPTNVYRVDVDGSVLYRRRGDKSAKRFWRSLLTNRFSMSFSPVASRAVFLLLMWSMVARLPINAHS